MEKLAGLSKSEIKTVKFIISYLKTQKNWVTGETILYILDTTDIRKRLGIDYILHPCHIRRFINIIRSESLAAIISSKNGYKISRNKEDLKRHIISLQSRAEAIMDAADGLKRILDK